MSIGARAGGGGCQGPRFVPGTICPDICPIFRSVANSKGECTVVCRHVADRDDPRYRDWRGNCAEMKETFFTLRLRAARWSQRKLGRITRNLIHAALADGGVTLTLWDNRDRFLGHWVSAGEETAVTKKRRTSPRKPGNE